MKKIFSLSWLILIAITAFAQDEAEKQIFIKKADSAIVEKVKLDFAVPDIPAFKALGIDPSNILRPSSAKDFSLLFNNFNNGGLSAIPKNLAVEVAPGLLIKPWYTLAEYRNNGGIRLLSKTRISLGTNEDAETGINNVSVGFRTTLLDKGDFRLNKDFQDREIYSKLEVIHTLMAQKRREIQLKYGIEVYAALPDTRKKEILDSLFLVTQNEAGFLLDKVIGESIEKYKKENWNATRMDVAYALLLQSPDSLTSNIKLNKHLVWATLALKPGKNNTWSQILLGVNNAAYSADGHWVNEFTGNFRFYAGTNKIKGLFEVQYQNIDRPVEKRLETLYTQLGLEVNLFKGAWIHFATGIINALQGDNKSALKSNLNIYLTFPENFNPFR
jgi:hypothetical protein